VHSRYSRRVAPVSVTKRRERCARTGGGAWRDYPALKDLADFVVDQSSVPFGSAEMMKARV